MLLTDAIDHRGGGHRLNDATPLTSVDNVVVQQKANDLMCCERVAATVHTANTIGITVCNKAQVVRVPAKVRCTWTIVVDDRLGMDASEKRVVLSIERGDFALGSAQDFIERASADAEQRIMRKP
jgi:hypothetical protein